MPRRSKDSIIDEMDKKILGILREDCLVPFVKIARTLEVNEGTIRHRIKRLMRRGIIRRFTVATDPAILGLGVLAFVLLNISPGQVNYVAQELSKLSAILEIHEIHTYGDLLLKVRTGSMNDLAQLLSNQIKTIEGVIGSQVISVLNVWKEEFLH